MFNHKAKSHKTLFTLYVSMRGIGKQTEELTTIMYMLLNTTHTYT